MSKFVLKPARLLQTRLVTSKTDPEFSLDFKSLVKRFAPTNVPFERAKLLNLKHGMFIGLSRSQKRPGEKCIFILSNTDRSGDIAFVLKKDPSFETRIVESFFLEEVEYDAKVIETPQKVA